MKIMHLLAYLSCVSPAFAADFFWQWNDDGWCLRSETRTTCLPRDYYARDITTDQILFVWKDGLRPGRFVRYYFEPVQPGKTWMPGDDFVLASEHTSEATYMAKYVADSGSGAPHHATLFFMTLSSEFTLVIYGGDSEAISDLTQSIAQQWQQE